MPERRRSNRPRARVWDGLAKPWESATIDALTRRSMTAAEIIPPMVKNCAAFAARNRFCARLRPSSFVSASIPVIFVA